ncbi:hypothetical protein RDMS_01460, partial [Deinococcus sp. RL]
ARAELWRGLVAKDCGDWEAALRGLRGVPETSPLLFARARYQEGDLRLRLGQPRGALAALSEAAERLAAAGASAEEQARAHTRAATALRRLGRPAEGLTRWQAALALVGDPTWDGDALPRARLLSEGVPLLLALARPDEALALALEARRLLARPGPRRPEAAYRTRRTDYRVALAYLTRGAGLPYLQPFAGPTADHPDLVHARALLDALLAAPAAPGDREEVLRFDQCLSRALADPDPRRALGFTERALAMTDHPYAGAQACALHAEALLRAGQREEALGHINRAHALLRRVQTGLPGPPDADPGLTAGLLALEARASIRDGLPTLRWLRGALAADPALAPFRSGVWREAGRALEAEHPRPAEVLRALHPTWEGGPWRVRDALVLLETGDGVGPPGRLP